MNADRAPQLKAGVGQLSAFSTKRMMKPQHVPKVAAIFPSALVAIVHFKLSVLVGPSANVVFQRWFDSGESASGTDAVIASVESFLSIPIPALFFAAHPVYGMARGWWVATIINSVVWGLTIYASYVLAAWLLNKRQPAAIS